MQPYPLGSRLWLIGALLWACSPARAERAVAPLSSLFEQANHVALGHAITVSSQGGNDEIATLEVLAVLRGSPTTNGTFDVVGTPTDPEGHGFAVGQRLLLFLTNPLPAHPTALRSGGGRVFGLPDAVNPQALRNLLEAARDNGGRLPLPRVLQLLGPNAPAIPRGLLAAILADHTDSTDPVDADTADILTRLACAPATSVGPGIRHWAIRQIGRRRIDAGRACLAGLVRVARRRPGRGLDPGRGAAASATAADAATATAAAGALADFGGSDSANALAGGLTGISKQLVSSCDGSLGFANEAALGLGKLGAQGVPVNTKAIGKSALRVPDTGLASTAVHALGLVGDRTATGLLGRLAKRHPHPLIRNQASETLARLGR